MNCDPNALMQAARGFRCLPHGALRAAWVYLACQYATDGAISVVILEDPAGIFWRLVTDVDGNLGTTSDPGPKTPDVILADSGGGFWKLVVNTGGNRGAESSPGPATLNPVIIPSGNGLNWRVVADTSGNVGTLQV